MPSIQQLFSLTGRRAIVTGGSRGIGFEIAQGLAEAGASVMVCARREEWLRPAVTRLLDEGARVVGTVCDVSNPADAERVARETMAAFGGIDILVNNAGISWGAEPEDMPLDQWRAVLDTNLTGAFLCAQAAGRHMLESGGGSIINVASIAAMHVSLDGPHYAGYAASKAGLLGLTRELAGSWGRRGIRVNAIAPGFFPTRLTRGIIDAAEARLRTSAPIPRAGREGELKGAAVFLASEASSYITGQVIVVDGGLTIA